MLNLKIVSLGSILIGLLQLSWFGYAFDTVTFITSQDRYTVKKTSNGFTVDGKAVQTELLNTLNPLLTDKATEDCPTLPKKAPVSAVFTKGTNREIREFFINPAVVRVSSKCLFANGPGLFYLPLHRSWLIGPFRESITFSSPLTITNNDRVLASLVKKDGEWADAQEKSQLDWDFFQRFRRSLADYRVQYRILAEASKGKRSVAMQAGPEKYKFYQLEPKLWAVQRPGKPWLDASGDWAFWYDMDNTVWQDRHAPLLQKAEADGATKEQKLEIFGQLDSEWSRALEDFYQRRMLDSKEDPEIRIKAISRLRTKPSWRNMGAFIKLVQSQPSDDLLKDATQALRARNPKGTLYQPDQTTRSQVVDEWTSWWTRNSHRKD